MRSIDRIRTDFAFPYYNFIKIPNTLLPRTIVFSVGLREFVNWSIFTSMCLMTVSAVIAASDWVVTARWNRNYR